MSTCDMSYNRVWQKCVACSAEIFNCAADNNPSQFRSLVAGRVVIVLSKATALTKTIENVSVNSAAGREEKIMGIWTCAARTSFP